MTQDGIVTEKLTWSLKVIADSEYIFRFYSKTKVIAKIYLYFLQTKGSLAVATHSPKHSSEVEFLGNYSNLHDKSGEQRLSESSQPIRLWRPERRPECYLNTMSSSPLRYAGQCKSSTMQAKRKSSAIYYTVTPFPLLTSLCTCWPSLIH